MTLSSSSNKSIQVDNDDNKNNNNMITQTLGGISYSLRASPSAPWIQTIGKTVVSIMAIPILVPVMFFHSILMATPIRNTLISMFIPFVMEKVEKEFHQERQTLLENTITSDCIVLDLGSGGGAYMRYCTNAKQVIAVEPIEEMHPKIKKAGQNIQNLTILKNIMDIDKSIQFNVIILGNVLCEVPNVQEMLHQVDRRLVTTGGKVFFSEHIARPRGTWQRHVQNILNPMWRHLSGGCNCNRESLDCIQKVQDWQVISWSYPHHSVGLGPFVLGLAMKKKSKQHNIL